MDNLVEIPANASDLKLITFYFENIPNWKSGQWYLEAIVGLRSNYEQDIFNRHRFSHLLFLLITSFRSPESCIVWTPYHKSFVFRFGRQVNLFIHLHKNKKKISLGVLRQGELQINWRPSSTKTKGQFFVCFCLFFCFFCYFLLNLDLGLPCSII